MPNFPTLKPEFGLKYCLSLSWFCVEILTNLRSNTGVLREDLVKFMPKAAKFFEKVLFMPSLHCELIIIARYYLKTLSTYLTQSKLSVARILNRNQVIRW